MFARTERLLLRPGWREDAPALFQAIADEAIVRNLASPPWPYSLADAQAFLATERRPDEASFLIFRRTRGAPQLIGTTGLGRRPSGAIELGYWIARPHWGLGYATEAANAVIAIARDGLRLEAAGRRPLPRQSGVGPGAARSWASGPTGSRRRATVPLAAPTRPAGCSN